MAEEMERRPFSSLSAEEQAAVREKQRLAKERKKASGSKSQKPPDQLPAEVGGSEEQDYPDRITEQEYFGACPRFFFATSWLVAGEENLEIVMRCVDEDKVLGKDSRGPISLSQYMYFIFIGSQKQIWDPTFYAKLAYEGFFTITNQDRGGEPLPELQPFYGVVDWVNFNRSKHIRKVLNKLKAACQKRSEPDAKVSGDGESVDPDSADSTGTYYMYSNLDVDGTYERIDAYQQKKHGCNWMHKKYFVTMKVASADPRINFKLHSIELYDAPAVSSGSGPAAATPAVSGSPNMIAGEIGYSIGRVYTSLSGFYSVPGAGTLQLACLGKWLEFQNYAFWSLGHCYSPMMEYKRQLGHRIYPRADFLKKLRRHRGSFRVSEAEPAVTGECDFAILGDRQECNLELALKI